MSVPAASVKGMRLLHTSDWHLGRSFHGVGMLDAQRNFVDHLVKTVEDRQVDMVLIAGDVYDRALPGVDVVNLLDEALARITQAGADVVLTSGNHDSPGRLGFGGRILERGGVHLRTRLQDIPAPVMRRMGQARLAVYGLPYLEPRMVAEPLGAPAPTHTDVLRAALQLVRQDADSHRAAGPVHVVVLAHLFASGGLTSESERDLSIGGVGAVPLDLFDGFGYVALGHLHGLQSLSPTVRYSGSPVHYSFSEARQEKGAWLVEFAEDGLRSVERIEWPAARKLSVLRGNLEDLLGSADYVEAEDSYCQITLTDAERPARAMERLRERFPHALVLVFDPPKDTREGERSYSRRIAQANGDLDICCGFLEHVRGRAAAEAEQRVLRETLQAVQAGQAAL